MIALLPNCAYLSETSRMVEIHRALEARGEPARVVTHGGSHEFYLREAGLDYDLLEPRMDEARCREFVANGAGMGPPNQSMYSDEEIRAQVAAQAAWFRANEARAVVTGFTLTALLSARVAGIPLIASHAGSAVPPLYERNLFPVRRQGLAGKLPEPVHRWLSNTLVQRLKLYCGGYNRVARELGVEGVPSFAALLLGDLTLVTDIPEVVGISDEDMRGWKPKRPASYRAGARLRYVGPIFAHGRASLDEETKRFLASDEPTVYVAITSTPTALVRSAVTELKANGRRLVVASTVHSLDDLADERTLVRQYFPSHLVMPRVDAAVIAGGQGSVQTAAAAGTPFVGIPLQPEQHLNVHLMEKRGAAIGLPPAQVHDVDRPVERILREPGFRVAAARLAELFAEVDGPARAADEIVEYTNRADAAFAPRS